MKNMLKTNVFGLSVASALLALPSVGRAADTTTQPTTASETGAAAQNDAGQAGNDIVVTGSRLREESVQRTPVAVAVMSPVQIEKLHATDIIGLNGKVANVFITTIGTAPAGPTISIRGFYTQAADIAI